MCTKIVLHEKRRGSDTKMSWGTANPTKIGWYLVTVEGVGGRHVMPLFRREYPEGNWTWEGLSGNIKVVASLKFPTPYKGDK